MKRYLSVVLILVLCISMVPYQVFADNVIVTEAAVTASKETTGETSETETVTEESSTEEEESESETLTEADLEAKEGALLAEEPSIEGFEEQSGEGLLEEEEPEVQVERNTLEQGISEDVGLQSENYEEESSTEAESQTEEKSSEEESSKEAESESPVESSEEESSEEVESESQTEAESSEEESTEDLEENMTEEPTTEDSMEEKESEIVPQELKIIEQPKDYVGLVETKVIYSVKAEGDGLTYQWQFSGDNGKSWINGNATTKEYLTALKLNREGRMIRCIVTDQYGNQMTTDVVTMKIKPVEILVQPQNYAGASGTWATFRVEAEGGKLSYQWQLSIDGGKHWINGSSTTSEYLTLMKTDRNGRMIRCIVTDQSGNQVVSEVVFMEVRNDIKILEHPQNQMGPEGMTAVYTIKAEGDSLTYLWQFSADGGQSWIDGSSIGMKYLTVLKANRNGRLIRCIVTDQYGRQLISQAAVMEVRNEIKILEQPKDYVGFAETTASYNIKATGDGLTYQWQFSLDGGENWRDGSSTGMKYLTVLKLNRNGRLIRCIVTDQYGNEVMSDIVTMSLKKVIFTKQPSRYVGEAGTQAVFSVETDGDGVTYQWQLSTNGGLTWFNQNATSRKYVTVLTAASNGHLVRCIATDAYGYQTASDAVRMTLSSEYEVRCEVVKTAIEYLGCKESDGSHRVIIDGYNAVKPLPRGYKVSYTDAWCATFVSFIAIECELTDIMFRECSCGVMISLYQKAGRWQENDAYIPDTGDIIMYDWNDNGVGDCVGYPEHVGFVVGVSGNTITVIEGNKSHEVAFRTIDLDGVYIRGYCLPDYWSKVDP